MKITCPYCGNLFESSNAQCPHCFAPNDQSPETTDGSPATIDELRRWYANRHLPPYETTRFFIGENISEPRAFGIYREGDRVIVYKNKNDGSRMIRYDGYDEGYAVSEFLNKLKEEFLHQKQINFAVKNDLPVSAAPSSPPSGTASTTPAKRRGCLTKILLVLLILLILSLIFGRGGSSSTQDFSDYGGSSYSGPVVIVPNTNPYYSAPSYSNYSNTYPYNDYGSYSFPEYTDPDDFSQDSHWDSGSSSSSWNSDSDWDWGSSDSWDSGSTDWDSDW